MSTLPLSQWPAAAGTVLRTYGARGAVHRAVHELRRRTGAFRAAPSPFVDHGAPGTPLFRVDDAAVARATDRAVALARADRVLGGEFQAYRNDWRPLPSDAAGWLRNPRTGFTYARDIPWWRVAHNAARAGDIKDVWEPARFGWAYDLVRAFRLTGDERYARAFHEQVARWSESSPPFRGVHWSCGQETAIRAIAVLVAESNLADASASDARARERITTLLALSGERIADAIGYAISQRNNHAISEAAGLIALGTRLRGVHRDAGSWLRRGHRLLERLIREQFADDGWYIQHSFTYLRLALDQCVVASRALAGTGAGLSPAAMGRIDAAASLVLAVVDDETGIVPNHGANDGAFVLPLSLAPYRDFRPALTAACSTFGLRLPEDVEPDAETLAWLGTPPPGRAPARRDGVTRGSGWAVARVGGTAVFVRAGRYDSRPSHIDALHADVRMGGREVVVDPGTFAYNAPPPWRNALVGAGVHNGPVLDGREPGVRGPRFLWLRWPDARIEEARFDSGVATIVACIPGRVRRRVTVSADRVTVNDEALDPMATRMRACWLLHPDTPAPALHTRPAARLVHAAESDATGWFSPHYGERIPSVALVVDAPAHEGVGLVCQTIPAEVADDDAELVRPAAGRSGATER